MRDLSTYGFRSMAREARTDFAMLMGSMFLLMVGGGPLALDQKIVTRTHGAHGTAPPA